MPRKKLVIGLAAALTTVSVPAAAYYWSIPRDNALHSTLRGFGFLPLPIPSNLMTVGSLYYVDPSVTHFKPICYAAATDLEGRIRSSPSIKMEADLQRNGKLSVGVTLDMGASAKSGAGKSYEHKVHYSLTEVRLTEISLGENEVIFARLMAKRECDAVATRLINAGAYVCQGQLILQANGEYKLGLDAQSKLETQTKLSAEEITKSVKRALEANGEQNVVDKDGSFIVGAGLNYGVAMNPTCIMPQHGRFERVLPKSVFGRVANYIKFHIIESMWPMPVERVAAAAAPVGTH